MKRYQLIIGLLIAAWIGYSCSARADDPSPDSSVMQAYYWDDAQAQEDQAAHYQEQRDELRRQVDRQRQKNFFDTEPLINSNRPLFLNKNPPWQSFGESH